MSETIFNADGSVYMTFGPSIPSRADTEGWMVRRVTSGSHRSFCPRPGSRAVSEAGPESFNGVLRLVGGLADEYGYRPVSSRVGGYAYRWTFERFTPDGHRVTDMIIVSRID